MQLLYLLASALSISGTLAVPPNGYHHNELERRQLSAIRSAAEKVTTSLNNLGTAIQGVTTDPNSALPLLTASQNAEAALKAATTEITNANNLGLIQSLGLQQIGSGISTAVESTIGALVAKKPVLDQLGVTSVALQGLQSQKVASQAFGEALVSKVPGLARPIAQKNVDGIAAILDRGIAAMGAPARPTVRPPTTSRPATTSSSGVRPSVAPVPPVAPSVAPVAPGTPVRPSVAPVAPVAPGPTARPSTPSCNCA